MWNQWKNSRDLQSTCLSSTQLHDAIHWNFVIMRKKTCMIVRCWWLTIAAAGVDITTATAVTLSYLKLRRVARAALNDQSLFFFLMGLLSYSAVSTTCLQSSLQTLQSCAVTLLRLSSTSASHSLGDLPLSNFASILWNTVIFIHSSSNFYCAMLMQCLVSVYLSGWCSIEMAQQIKLVALGLSCTD